MTQTELSPALRLWRILRGAMEVQALRVAAELRIADEIGDGARAVDELAERTGASSDALYRFLRALAGEGVFAEVEPRVFANTEASDLLRSGNWSASAHFFGGVWHAALGESLHAARTGGETFGRAHGEDWWSWLTARPDETTRFNRMMQGDAERRVDAIADAFADGETVADVGGGNGSFLIGLLRRRPGLRGIVFDLPEVAKEAAERVARAGLADRCTVVAGSAFDAVPPGADVYLLASVLHDWDDDAASAILRSVRAAAGPDARLLIADAVLPDGDEPHESKWLDLLMLVLTGGRERTEPEWRALLGATGFEIVRTRDGLLECR